MNETEEKVALLSSEEMTELLLDLQKLSSPPDEGCEELDLSGFLHYAKTHTAVPNPRKHYDWITSYLDFTEETEPEQLFRTWAAVYILAATLQRKVWLEWGLEDIFPNFFVVLVGPSGRARKSTAMHPAEWFLAELGIKKAAAKTTNERLIEELKQAEEELIIPNTGESYKHSSLAVLSKELVVLLGYNNPDFLGILSDWWDNARSWEYTTKQSNQYYIDNVCVNLFGATTPELIRSSLPTDTVGGGLASRIIFVYSDRRAKKIALPSRHNTNRRAQRQELLHDLSLMQGYIGRMTVDDSFEERWVHWYMKEADKSELQDLNFQGYNSRRPMHLLKLSMIMAASRRHNDQSLIEALDLDRAITLLELTEQRMPRVFAGYGSASTAEVVEHIYSFIVESNETTVSEVFSVLRPQLEDYTQLTKLLNSLHKGKYITLTRNGTDTTIKPDKTHAAYKRYT